MLQTKWGKMLKLNVVDVMSSCVWAISENFTRNNGLYYGKLKKNQNSATKKKITIKVRYNWFYFHCIYKI